MVGPIVAVIGATGYVGKFLTPVLLEALNAGRFKEVRILTSTMKVGDELVKSFEKRGAKIIPVEYGSNASLTTGFKGADVALSLLGTGKGMDMIWNNLLDALKAAQVKAYFPSEFDSNLEKPPGSEFVSKLYTWQLKKIHFHEAKQRGLKPIRIITASILEYLFVPFLGLDCPNNKWTVVGNAADIPLAVTAQRDIGKYTVEAILLAHNDLAQCPDELEIYSEVRTLREYAAAFDKVSGKVTTFETVPYEVMLEKQEKSGDFGQLVMLMFARGAYDFTKSKANQLLNPNQSKWKLMRFEEFAEATGGIPKPDSVSV